MADLVSHIATRVARVGMNLVGATTVAAYDALAAPAWRLADRADGARGMIVVGNGGGALWRAFRAERAACAGDDPLDAFTRAAILNATEDVAGARCSFPFAGAAPQLDFRLLGELAGLGRRSLLGLLVHPVYGPWLALRAAILVPDEVAAPRPADGFDPCPSCVERPCVAACPVAAVGAAGWDAARCVDHRTSAADGCAAACAARVACVHGRAHVPPADALAFHQAAARRSMLAYASAARNARASAGARPASSCFKKT